MRNVITRTSVGLCAAALLAVMGASLGSAAFPGANGKIAFTCNGNVCSMNPDGSEIGLIVNRTPLPGWDSVDYLPTWSADGRRLAFQSTVGSNWELFVVDADGTNEQQLTDNTATDTHPAWAPDGRRLAFVSSRSPGAGDIYVLEQASGVVSQLTASVTNDTSPAWSPDGQWIAFASDRDGDFEIYKMRPDGSGVARLTNNATQDLYPDWSADSQRVVFYGDDGGNADIYVVAADGSASPTRLTTDPGPDITPVYSPDGARIAFVSTRATSCGGSQFKKIYEMAADGSDEREVDCRSGDQEWPDWQPLVVRNGPPTSKEQCKKDGWRRFDTPRRFKNQGDCVSFVTSRR